MTDVMTNYDRMSPALRAQVDTDDRDFRQSLAAEERRRELRARNADEARIRAAIELAQARGETVNPAEVWRTGGAVLGRTPGEAVAYYSALADAEEARARAAAPPAVDSEQYQAALRALDPALGRTKQEALRYYSAVADMQDIEAARAAAQGLPSPDEQVAARTALEKRQEKYTARAREQHLWSVARSAARGEVERERQRQLERQFRNGDLTEDQYLEAHREIA